MHASAHVQPIAPAPRPVVTEAPRPLATETPLFAAAEAEAPALLRAAAPEPDDEPVINFPEILARGDSVIEFAIEPDEADEPVIMDNGSIRSFNTEAFRVPTFVRKQMD
jgi:hypothetical protein